MCLPEPLTPWKGFSWSRQTRLCFAAHFLRISITNWLASQALVASESPIGYRVIIDSRHWGMIYKNQIFQRISVGDRVEAYVRRITEDNRIDLSLRREGYDGVAASAESVYDLLKSQGGVLEVGDDSTPEAIHAETQMSKKVFKRAVGILLKRGDIVADKYQIRLK